MKKIVSILAILAAFLPALSAQTEENIRKLTVEEAVELAIQNNISIKQSKMQLNMYEKQKKNAVLNAVASPRMSVGVGLNDSFPNGQKSPVTGKENENAINFSVSGSASLSFTPALITQINSAKIAYENGENTYNTTKRTVEMTVRQTFYSLLNMKESIDSTLKAADAARRTYESNLAKYNRGHLDQLTLLTSQYNYERQLPGIDSLKNSYQNTLDNLKQVLGINLTEAVVLEGNLDDILNVKLDEAILQQNLEEIPSVKNVKQSLKSVENSLRQTKYSAYGPSASISFNYSGGAGIEPSKDFANNSISLGLNISVPLDGYIPWSNGAMSIDNQKLTLERTKLQLEDTKTTAAISIRNSFNTILNAQSQLKIYESNLELMQKTYDMMQVAYNNGTKDLNSLQTAEDNLTTARTNLQNQKYTIINAVLRLEDTLGLPFGTLSQQSNKEE